MSNKKYGMHRGLLLLPMAIHNAGRPHIVIFLCYVGICYYEKDTYDEAAKPLLIFQSAP